MANGEKAPVAPAAQRARRVVVNDREASRLRLDVYSSIYTLGKLANPQESAAALKESRKLRKEAAGTRNSEQRSGLEDMAVDAVEVQGARRQTTRAQRMDQRGNGATKNNGGVQASEYASHIKDLRQQIRNPNFFGNIKDKGERAKAIANLRNYLNGAEVNRIMARLNGVKSDTTLVVINNGNVEMAEGQITRTA